MLTQENIDKIFNILRIVHTSHWKAPNIKDVKREIQRVGAYIFRAGRDPWVADVRITETAVSYGINAELPERMKAKAEQMKKRFEELAAKP